MIATLFFYTLLFCCTQNTRWWSTCITKASWSAAEKLKEAPALCGTLLSCLTSLQEKSVSCESCLSLWSCRWKNFGVSHAVKICQHVPISCWHCEYSSCATESGPFQRQSSGSRQDWCWGCRCWTSSLEGCVQPAGGAGALAHCAARASVELWQKPRKQTLDNGLI